MRVHHSIEGSGERTLVLSNAIGTTTALWDRQIADTAASFRVIRTDHRGHGGTALGAGVRSVADLAGDVLELLDELGITRASVAGISLGGNVAMWLGANAPERVDRLVLGCTAAAFGSPGGWLERAATVRMRGTGAIADMSIGRWFTTRTRLEQPALVERFREELCEVSDEGYAGCCDALAEWDFADQLSRIAAPTLVIAGAADPSTPPEVARVVADGIPGAILEVIEDAAHLANVDQPARFTRLLLDHLRATTVGQKEHA